LFGKLYEPNKPYEPNELNELNKPNELYELSTLGFGPWTLDVAWTIDSRLLTLDYLFYPTFGGK